MTSRERLSASVDADLLDAARAAVEAGHAPNVSAWVNHALRRQAEHDEKMRAIDDFLAAYEAEHGEISAAEIAAAQRRARSKATIVRGQPTSRTGAA